jgi:hypothetical protein
MAASKLTVLVEGEPLAEAEARAFWARFSAFMDEHKGDLGGFARSEGFASVHPKVGPDGPVLVVSRTIAQSSYTSAGSLRSTHGSKQTQKSATPRTGASRRKRP